MEAMGSKEIIPLIDDDDDVMIASESLSNVNILMATTKLNEINQNFKSRSNTSSLITKNDLGKALLIFIMKNIPKLLSAHIGDKFLHPHINQERLCDQFNATYTNTSSNLIISPGADIEMYINDILKFEFKERNDDWSQVFVRVSLQSKPFLFISDRDLQLISPVQCYVRIQKSRSKPISREIQSRYPIYVDLVSDDVDDDDDENDDEKEMEATATATATAIAITTESGLASQPLEPDTAQERKSFLDDETVFEPEPELEPALGPAPELEPALGPAPELEPALGPAPELEPAPGPAPELEPAPGLAPELEPALVPASAFEPELEPELEPAPLLGPQFAPERTSMPDSILSSVMPFQISTSMSSPMSVPFHQPQIMSQSAPISVNTFVPVSTPLLLILVAAKNHDHVPEPNPVPQPRQRSVNTIPELQRRLMLLHHGTICNRTPCPLLGLCKRIKQLLTHISRCCDEECTITDCVPTRLLLNHHFKCQKPSCHLCPPVRQRIDDIANDIGHPVTGAITSSTSLSTQPQAPVVPVSRSRSSKPRHVLFEFNDNPSDSNVPESTSASVPLPHKRKTEAAVAERLEPSNKRPTNRHIQMLHITTGELLRAFSSQIEAANFLNIRPAAICNACNGRMPQACGFKWQWVAGPPTAPTVAEMSREDILKMLSLPRKYTNPQIPPLASQLPVSVDATEMSVAVPVAVPVAPSEVAPTLDIQSTNAANADTKKRHVNVRSWIDSHPDDSSFETYIVWCFQDDVRQIPVTDAYFNTVLKEALQSKNKLPESSTVSLYDQLKVDATMTATRSRARVRARTIPDDAEVQSAREKLKYDSSTTSKVDSDTTPTAKRVTTPSGKVNVSLKYRRLLIDAIYRNLESKYQSLNRSQMFALAANLENHLYVTVDSIFAYMDTVTLKSRLEVARDALKHMQMNMLTPMTGSLTPYRGKMCQPQAALQPDILAHSMQSSEPHSSQFSFDVNEDDDSEYRDDSEYEISGHY